jgi:RISC-loading complex subunit TARBP2
LLAVGSGRSKKEAKHDAAKCLLNRLNAQGETAAAAADPDTVGVLDVSDITSPYKGMLQQNAVGALQELCMVHDIQVPEYTMTGDEGPPHAKQFTIMCQVSKLTESGRFMPSQKNCSCSKNHGEIYRMFVLPFSCSCSLQVRN